MTSRTPEKLRWWNSLYTPKIPITDSQRISYCLLSLLTYLLVGRGSTHVSSHNLLLVNFRLDNNTKTLHFCQPILHIAGRVAPRKLRWFLQASNKLGCTDQWLPRIALLSGSEQGEISRNNMSMAKFRFSMKHTQTCACLIQIKYISE